MSNNLKQIQKELRTLAKRCKNIRYTQSLLLCFLIMRTLLFSSKTSSPDIKKSQDSITKAKKQIGSSMDNLKQSLKKTRAENDKLLNDANMELIKLMEEGDQVIKSPWSSWQFGTTYSYTDWRGFFKGTGDKSLKYSYEGIFQQGTWWENMANRNGEIFKNLGLKSNRRSALDSDRTGLNLTDYGLLELGRLPEPIVTMKVGGRITPKSIVREEAIVNPPVNININAPTLPLVNVPKLELTPPNVAPIHARTAKTFNINLGSYCNALSGDGCDTIDEQISGWIYHNDHEEDYSGGGLPPYPRRYGPLIGEDRAYAGFRYRQDYGLTWGSVGGGNITSSALLTQINAANPGLNATEFNDPTLRYSWNLEDYTRANGQWRLFKIYFDVQSDTSDPYNPVPGHLTIDNNITIDSENYSDIVSDADEISKRDFNTQEFLIGGSRVATLDNAAGGGSITNNSTLNLRGPLTIGLEVQYDKIGNKSRKLLNSAKINDTNENDIHTAIGGLGPGQSYSQVHGKLLNLGIYNWKTWEEIYGSNIFETLKYTAQSADTPLNSVSCPTGSTDDNCIDVYRNSKGYLGAKVGMILTREDGEYSEYTLDYNLHSSNPNDYYTLPNYWTSNRTIDDKYQLINNGQIEFHGDKSIGIQIYSPYSGTRIKDFVAEYEYTTYQCIDGSDPTSNRCYPAAWFYKDSVPPIVEVMNTNVITTTGSESYGIKVSSGIDTAHSSITNGSTGTINVAGYNEYGEFRNRLYSETNSLDGASAGMAVIEDKNQQGYIDYSELSRRDTFHANPDRFVDPRYRTVPTVVNPSPKPVSTGDTVKNYGTINVAGTGNMGMFLKTTFKDTLTNEQNATINLGKIEGNAEPQNNDLFNEKNIGMRIETGEYVDHDSDDGSTVSPGVQKRNTSLNRADSRQRGINKGTINIKSGDTRDKLIIGTPPNEIRKVKGKNIGMLASGGDAVVENQNKINIGDVAGLENKDIRENIGMAAIAGNANTSSDGGRTPGSIKMGTVINTKEINIKKGENNIGMYIDISSTLATDKGYGLASTDSVINIEDGEGNIGVYNRGKFILHEGKIKVKGKKSVGVYAEGSHSLDTTAETNLKGTIEVEGGAVAMFTKNATMDLNSLTTTVKDGGLLFYKVGTGGLKINDGNVNATIKTGGNAFYDTSASSPATILDSINPAGGMLNLTMERGSRLFILGGGAINLSSVTPPSSGPLRNSSNTPVATITGTGYKFLTTKYATLNIDRDVNLNDADDAYHLTDAIASNVNVNKKMTNNGQNIANDIKYAIAQSQDKTTGVTAADLKITNNNVIELTNQAGVVGAIVDFGTIDNNGTVKNNGDNGVGLVGARGSIVNNNASGTVTIGKNGVGLYGINNLDSTITEGKISLNNSGTINAEGENPYGIIALNRNNTITDSVISLNGGTINFAANNNGVAVYGLNSTINNNGGNIVLGNNGLGINAKGLSVINLNGGTITGSGNDAKGIYSDKGFTNANTNIDLQGNNSIGMFSTEFITNNATIKVGNSTNASSPAIAMYAPTVTNTGTVTSGTKSIGIYSNSGNANISGTLNVGIEGTGIYKTGGNVTINNGTVFNIGSKGVAVFASNANVADNNSTELSLGTSAMGFALEGGNYSNIAGTQTMGTDSVYIYAKNGSAVTNNKTVTMTGDDNVALYGKDGATITNNADINQGSGIQNVGILITGSGTGINNAGKTITVSKSLVEDDDPDSGKYSIGMAGQGAVSLINNGNIIVNSHRSIGMYGSGNGTRVENHGNIILNASSSTTASPIEQMTGMYLTSGATGVNYGNIRTANDYTTNSSVKNIMGVIALNGSTFENRGTIEINANSGVGIRVENSRIKNYGHIIISGTGSVGVQHANSQSTDGQTLGENDSETTLDSKVNASGATINTSNLASKYLKIDAYDPTKLPVGGVELKPVNGTLRALVDGVVQDARLVSPDLNGPVRGAMFTDFGVYVDTLGRTRGIEGSGFNPRGKIDVVIGAEAAEKVNDKTIKVPWETLRATMEPLLTNNQVELNIYSGALHWFASYDQNEKSVTMVKVPYEKYAKDANTYNYLYGVEARYGLNSLASREKMLFNKLNSIGDNQNILWAQAAEEMIGRQYANTNQRLYKTSTILDDEIGKLSKDRNFSKNSNKITSFGTRGEYKTETAGIKDHTYNAYGIAYINQNETFKMGESRGWYGGIVNNTFKFKDIGKSKENTTLAKAGIYNTKIFGKNKNTSWTVALEGFVSRSEMNRRYLVVDDIFNAKSNYTGYGAAIKNEFAREFRASQRFSIRPYGSLKLGYGKFDTIKEKTGQLRLQVKGDDYYSVKPEAGIEFKFKQPFAKRAAFTTSLGFGYEAELGKIGDGENRLRVNYTDAKWYKIRGEKEDKKGNFKSDLNIGIGNDRFGVTINTGYETKGKNVKGGLGLKVLF